MGEKEKEILQFLTEKVFNDILDSPKASPRLKDGTRYTMARIAERTAEGMISYYWAAIIGTDGSVDFAVQMRKEGFRRFEDVIDEFRNRFNEKWLRS